MTVVGVSSVCVCVCVCVCTVCVCLSVWMHDKTEMAENKITKPGIGIVHHKSHPPNNIRSKVKGQGHSILQKDNRAAHMSYAL